MVAAAKLPARSTNRLPSGSVSVEPIAGLDDEGRIVRAGPRPGALDRAHPLDDPGRPRSGVGSVTDGPRCLPAAAMAGSPVAVTGSS